MLMCRLKKVFYVKVRKLLGFHESVCFFLIDWSVDNDCVLMFQVADKNEQT